MVRKFYRFLSALLLVSILLAGQTPPPAYAASFVVNTLSDNTTDDAFCTLREAILAANNAPANANCGAGSSADDTITFSVSGTITLGSTLPNIVSGQGTLTIDGSGQSITISGNNNMRVFEVNSGEDLTLQNLTVSNGRASFGGGIFNNGGTLTITNSTLSGNSATVGGGGGIFNNGGTLMITNSTLSGNSAGSGGGIFNERGTVNITNSTLSGNSASFGGGIFNQGPMPMNFKNSIVANSPSGGNCFNNGTSFNALGVNFATDGTCPSFTQKTSAQLNLGPLQLNPPGTTATHALQAGSAAIDAATDCTDISSNPVTQDQRGVARPQGTQCDVGAYEAVVVTLFITGSGSGSGTVTSTPVAITCTISAGSASGDCSESAVPGSNPTLTLTATPDAGSTFAGWSGDADCTDGSVTINTSKSCVATFNFVQQPPTVSGVAATGAGTLLQGQTLTTGPAQFTVTFNQDVTTTSAENTANYLLVRAGGNGVQTLDCAGGVSGGDTSISIDSAVYNSATRTAMLGVNGGQPLPAGLYRLFVCGTTSIVNANGDELYAGLTDYGLVFLVSTQTSGSGGGTGGTGTGDGSSETSTGALQLPDTGFTPDRVTALPPQPLEKTYSPTDLTLETPSLKVKSNIVGVLKSGDGWDVTWLGNSVGWLEGSAFPTWKGNTVLTAHVWNADNTPGVFAEIKDLKYGERFYVHAFGQTYVYEVRENARLWGSNRVDKAFKSEEYDWVTLLTCEGYNPLTGEYLFRRIVRAVLVEVK